MAQIDGPGFAGRQRLWPAYGCSQVAQHRVRHPRLAGRFENSRDVQMRSHLYARRSVEFSDVGEEKQHQQSATTRGDVGPPGGEILLLVPASRLVRKTHIDMPTGITGILRARKPYGKASKVRAWAPTSLSDELIKSRVKHGTIHRPIERFLIVITKPDDRPCPARRIVRITRQIAPQDGAALVGKLPGKSTINSDKSILNELLYLCAAQHAGGFMFTGRHHSITLSASASNFGGISSLSAFAVLRLITSSNFAGCVTGSSVVLVPLTILPT